MFNLLLVLGLCSLIKPLTAKKEVLKRDFIVSITATIILLIFMMDSLFYKNSINIISKGEGSVLLMLFFLYIYYMLIQGRKNKAIIKEHHDLTIIDVLMLLSGLLAIILGGELVINSSKNIALSFGISETLVGLTIVSIGTSLPELITSLVAVKKGETDIAIGNAIGSNIYNILVVLGLSSSVGGIRVNSYAVLDTIILIVVSAICGFLILKNSKITKIKAIILITMYLSFLIYVINR